MADDPFHLFALNDSQVFGAQVCHWLGIQRSAHEERRFEDGECKLRSLVSVRDQDVFVLHSLYGEPHQSCHDKLCRLLFFIGALKDAGAARVNAVVPYLAYARKDSKTKPRDPVTTRYIASLFEAVGTDALLTMDVHNLAACQNAFRIRFEHLQARHLLVAYLKPLITGRAVVVVSPDVGGVKRAEQFRQDLSLALGEPIDSALIEKYRSGDVLSGEKLAGDVQGKLALIVDDLISTGRTLLHAARICRAHGAAGVMAAATHGLFCGDIKAFLFDAALERIVVTDTVAVPPMLTGAAQDKLAVVSSSRLFAEAIKRLHTGGSIVALMAN